MASQERAAIKASHLQDIEHWGQMLQQKGAVLLVRNKFDNLMRGEPANAGGSRVEWGLRLAVVQGIRQEVMDCLILYVAVAFHRLAHDCAEVLDELDACQACLFMNLAQGCLLK